jgi:polar amino acid transport system ATP-binding protein
MAGLEKPDSGRLHLNDREVIYREKELMVHRRSVGTVFQAFNLFPHLTALQNITLPLEKVHHYKPPDARQVAEEILERFQLSEHCHKAPAQLSGGQRQRVAIARAISIKPKLLLFDEPTSALDPEMTAEVLEVIEELRKEGRDLVLVTHQMGFAHRIADQIALLSGGRIAECGPPSQVLDNPVSDTTREFLAKILKY